MEKLSLLLLTLLLVAVNCFAQRSGKILIAAASDLKFALDSIVYTFKSEHPDGQADVTYGSSGKLTEQIINGAPFDIFFSADISYPEKLQEKKLTISQVNLYGIGRLVVWSKKIDPTVNGIQSLLDSRVNKIAIANPAHAPYGKRAEEALKYYNMENVRNKIVLGENISQTAQFITSGAADIGIIAMSLALSPAMKKENGKYYILPQNSHKPLQQGFVILKNAENNKLAAAFAQFMTTSKAKQILSHFGFVTENQSQ